MLKKFTWIVALLAALTIVIGCTNAGVDPEWDDPDKDFKKFDLGEVNTFAGQPDKQQGWATNGYIDDENGVVVESAFKISDFTSARFLVIETEKNPTGGMQLVWQSKNFPATGWTVQKYDILANNSNANPGTTKKTGNAYGGATIRVDLPLVFGPSYGNYLEAADFLRFIIAYYSPDLDDLGIKEAYLLISDKKSVVPNDVEGMSDSKDFGRLGLTTIRNSSEEYGWKFSEKDKDGKLPKDTLDISQIRDATHLVIVSKSGGVKVNDKLVGFKELSVILKFTSTRSTTTRAERKVNDVVVKDEDGNTVYDYTTTAIASASETTSLGEYIGFAHGTEDVLFVIELSKLVGISNRAAKVGGYGDVPAANVPKGVDADPNKPKFDSIDLLLNYNTLDQFGLVTAYLIDDSANSDIPDYATVYATNDSTEKLDGKLLGIASGDFGYITIENVLLPILFEAPVELTIYASDGGTPPVYDQPYGGTGNGWIVGNDYTKLKNAKANNPGSFVRVTVENRSGSGRSGWGCGHFGTNNDSGAPGGANNFNAPSPFPADAVGFVDFSVDNFIFTKTDGSGDYNDLYVNNWNSVAYTKVELYVAK